MPKSASVKSLSDFPRLPISKYRDELKKTSKPDSVSVLYFIDTKEYHYKISITKTPCNYGGFRYWWVCPNCSRRVGVLYCDELYMCRHCIGVSYETQLMQPIYRTLHKADKIKKRLNDPSGSLFGIVDKPKGMHQKTYDELRDAYMETVGMYLN